MLTESTVPSKKSLLTARILGGILVLLLVMDGVMKLVKPVQVTEAMQKLGYPDSLSAPIGILLLVCTIIYAIPRSSIIGAILLTGYLGGAVATNLRAEAGAFPVVFPVIIGALLWLPLYLTNARLKALIPFRA